MTRKEFSILATSIKAVHANMFQDTMALDVWYSLLKDLPYKAAADSLQRHLQTNRFPPTVADIRKGAIPQADGGMSELEAWALARKAIRIDPEQAKEQYDKLPPVVQRAIGTVSNLCQWGMLPSDEVGTVIQSQFLRSYRIVRDRAADEAVISPALRDRLASNNIALLEDMA